MLKKGLDKNDLQVIELKYSAPRIEQLNDAQILSEVVNCIKRIHLITGWNLPDDEEYMKMLIEEFTLKLKEDFQQLNFKEIVAAFRKNGLGIKDWGKNMNLDLICSVLGFYCGERERISLEEERLKTKNTIVQKIYTDEEITNQRRGHIEAAYQCMRNGRVPIMHIYFPEILHMDDFIPMATDAEMTIFFVFSLNSGRENIYTK